MAILHIIEGPVGAGKTTYAIQLSRDLSTPPLVLDKWMVTLFQADRPETGLWSWYAERKTRCVSQILSVAYSLLDLGQDAIVELGLVKVEDRLKLYEALDSDGRTYRVHILDTSRDERHRRVIQRNAVKGETFAMHVSDEVFYLASDMWEPVEASEQQGREGSFHFEV
ncbi:AAA family ATPase [Hoeflea prorocentri]|uniref:AAA family ATPase n=1 Tax=Hoeflea prorocentri TaxID=1922333 RepID=A0A9X3UFG3_9HYPH|nr:AAA family ATPase [Hoeflea prorocentri]MCY6379565.1 AAA family ATPase [Hoeflea prorocentri]MDA5397365.1 AAA family ATPase [Hoeflea prorocentri]